MRVTPRALVLLHSPLVGAVSWGDLAQQLTAEQVQVVEVRTDDRPPYAIRYVAEAARQAAALQPTAEPPAPLTLVGQGGAGPLLPSVGAALRARGRTVAGYVFVDAGLPRSGGTASRLDLLAAADDSAAAVLRLSLAAGAALPECLDDRALEGLALAPADRILLATSRRPRTLDFFTEALPHPDDWPDAPCGYLSTAPSSAIAARLARARGWPVVEHPSGPFPALVDPAGTAAALGVLLDAM